MIVPFSTAMLFDGALATSFEVTLAGDVASVAVQNVAAGTLYTFDVGQDAAGNHAFPWGASAAFDAAPPLSPAPLTRTTQTFIGTVYQTLAPIQNGAINQG